jgi:hypothetical protein
MIYQYMMGCLRIYQYMPWDSTARNCGRRGGIWVEAFRWFSDKTPSPMSGGGCVGAMLDVHELVDDELYG